MGVTILIIGNEILSGRVPEENIPFLIKQFKHINVSIDHILIIPDIKEVIIENLIRYSQRSEWLITTGGIGPTPDDVTLSSIAEAFQVPIVENNELVKLLQDYHKDKFHEMHLKLASIPKGTKLIKIDNKHFPQLQFNNILMFPGVPKFMRDKFLGIQYLFKGKKIYTKEIILEKTEEELVAAMEKTCQKYPDISLGSYPIYFEHKTRVELIIEHENKRVVTEAWKFLMESIKDSLG